MSRRTADKCKEICVLGKMAGKRINPFGKAVYSAVVFEVSIGKRKQRVCDKRRETDDNITEENKLSSFYAGGS